MTIANKGSRYYVFDGQARTRVPADHTHSDAEAIDWSRSHYAEAINVVREEGAPTKPTSINVVWTAEVHEDKRIRVVSMDGQMWLVDPSALTAV